jgi:hypothetical protein
MLGHGPVVKGKTFSALSSPAIPFPP